MIINLRGTGGSGKSTIVRKVMDRFSVRLPNYVEGRRQPISYLLSHEGRKDLRVLGHYETPCGGCDTINSPVQVYELVNASASIGEDVLFEGIIIGDDVTRCVDLSRKTTVKVIALKTSMDVCLASIQERRNERGDVRRLDPKNTVNRNERLKRIMMRLRDARVDAVWMGREEALQTCLTAFGF